MIRQPTSDPLASINLLLLRVFVSLYEQQSVMKAAERLALSPSAISHSLRRLREVLDDELFVRDASKMKPTERAMELAPKVQDILTQLRFVLGEEKFDPATSTRAFALASQPYSGWAFTTKVIASVMEAAPQVSIRNYNLDENVTSLLDDGVVEVAVGNFPKLPDRFARKRLFSEPLVWVMRKGHPAERRPFTTNLIGELSHLKIDIDRPRKTNAIAVGEFSHRLSLDEAKVLGIHLERLNMKENIRATVPDIVSGLEICTKTDLIMLSPARIAAAFRDIYPLRICEPPYAAAGVDIDVIWHRELGQRDGTEWLVRHMERVASDLQNTTHHNV